MSRRPRWPTGRAGRLAAGTGLLLGTGALAHYAPSLSSVRLFRCRVTPGLAGVGARDHVALTFDDGPDLASTPQFLEALDQLGWKATFFLLGSQVQRDTGLAAEVARRGHEVAVHGYEHVSHLRRDLHWVASDIARAQDTIAAATGVSARWLRPPYGALATSTLLAARRCGLQTVLWTSWGKDWRASGTPDKVVRCIEATFEPGATVLLHDSDVTSAPGSWRSALGALPILAERWAAAGLTVGTLGEHRVPSTWRG